MLAIFPENSLNFVIYNITINLEEKQYDSHFSTLKVSFKL